MKNIIALTAAAATLALSAAPASAETRAERSEARVAEMLEGRTAGEGQNCITAFRGNRLEVIEHVGIAYKRGDTIWLARATNPDQLRYSDVPVIERYGSRLCRQDIIRTVDRYTGYFSGALFLEDFVPYTRVETEEDA